MTDVTYEIDKEKYDKAIEEGAYSIINPDIIMGYGVYCAEVTATEDGKYYLHYERGSSCD